MKLQTQHLEIFKNNGRNKGIYLLWQTGTLDGKSINFNKASSLIDKDFTSILHAIVMEIKQSQEKLFNHIKEQLIQSIKEFIQIVLKKLKKTQ